MLSELLTLSFLIKLVTAMLGTLGFALIFRSRVKNLPIDIVGGGLTYVIYFCVEIAIGSLFGAAFISSVVAAAFSEITARIVHAPATAFFLPCIIPTVPGSYIYYFMTYLITKNYDDSIHYLGECAVIGIGIAGGVFAVSIFIDIFSVIKDSVSKKRDKAEK
ncbi:MAG: threonine/serine exporter family protein [Clostridia bacterium]|nr:threonine/serine exporter family protein [Clostridia bacterium]